MPSNQVLINNAIEYFVVDDKMDELIDWLNDNCSVAQDDNKAEVKEAL